MPAEYLACVENYVKKGVSKKTAQARCAAAYYNRHGVTVNEAHSSKDFEPIGGMDMGEVDMDLVNLIMMDLNQLGMVEGVKASKSVKLTKKEQRAEITMSDHMISNVVAYNMDMLDDFNIVEIVATKVGAKAYTEEGRALTWTKQGLQAAEKTWRLTDASVNHDEETFEGKILASFLDGDLLRMVLKVTDKLKAWIKSAGKLIGVSIEAINVKINKDYEIISAVGDGVTFVFPPHEPACGTDEGCGIVAAETTETITAENKYFCDKCGAETIEENVHRVSMYAMYSPVESPGDNKDFKRDVCAECRIDIKAVLDAMFPIKATATEEDNITPSDNINEDGTAVDESSTPDITGDKMADEEVKTICAEKHAAIVKDKDSTIEKLTKEMDEIRATLAQYETERKNVLLESLKKESIDIEPYKDDNIATLEKLVNAVKAFKTKLEEEVEENSGAKVKATEALTDPDGDALAKMQTDAAETEKKRLVEEEAKRMADIDKRAAEKGYTT